MAPTKTRASHAAILKHIIEVVMNQDADSPLSKSLKKGGYDVIADVLAMSSTDIDILDYEETDGANTVTLALLPARKNLIRALQAFVRHRQNIGTPVVDFLAVTMDEFNEYRVSVYNPNAPAPVVSPSTRPTTTRATIVSTFKQGIKRDKSHYVALREDKQWDSWRRSTLATARSHSCEAVFDPTFVPSSSEDRELFAEKTEVHLLCF